MRWWSQLTFRIRSLFGRPGMDAQLAEEVRTHVEMATEANLAKGMSPRDARFAALREFGNVVSAQERTRDERGWVWLEHWSRDLRYGCRSLRQNPGFASIAVLSLAIGIGAVTAIFGVINEALLKPLPVEEPQEVVRFTWSGDIANIKGSFFDAWANPRGGHFGTKFTTFTFQRLQEANETLQSLFASLTIDGHTVVIDGNAEGVGSADYVTGDYFEGLGVHALRGRVLTAEDDRADTPPGAMISHGYWQQRFGGDDAVIGKTVLINLIPVTIVGVTPPEFHGLRATGAMRNWFLPFALLEQIAPSSAPIVTNPGHRWTIEIMGRLKGGTSVAQAQANFATVFRQSAFDGSRASVKDDVYAQEELDDSFQLSLNPASNGSELLRLEAAQPLTILVGLMGAMLLISCINVANLLLARGSARRREIAVRLALGAGRSRIVRQLLVESLLLAGAGGMLGVVFAYHGANLMASMVDIGGVRDIAPDWRVFGFALAVATVSGVLFGLVPALRATRIDLNTEFQGGPRTIGQRSGLRLGKILMVAQVALSFVVLAGAGLFVTTLGNLRAVDLGFPSDHLLLFRLEASPAGYTGDRIAPLFERVADRIRTLPGVESVTFTNRPVVGGWGDFYGTRIVGQPVGVDDHPRAAAINEVDSSFFATYGLRSIQGRTLEPRDGPESTRAVVVNQSLAETFFPGKNPLGQRIMFGGPAAEIVGVVRDIKYSNLRNDSPPTIYSAFAQRPAGSASFTVRTTVTPRDLGPSIRQVVHDIDPHVPVLNLHTQNDQIEWLTRQERMFARLSAIIGGLALLLVCVGLYGLMSYAVHRRTGEIGLRMALGALPRQVGKLILRESSALVAVGVVAGAVGSFGVLRTISSLLYGVSTTDPWILALVAIIQITVSLLASFVPARRAVRVDPIVALRAE